MGGAFDIKRFIFGYYDNNCYYNNPPDYLSELNDEWYLKNLSQMGIILGTGEHDFCLGENLRISDLLQNKWIPHWLISGRVPDTIGTGGRKCFHNI
jgi:esterase/lipase superfamily enzyme